MGLKLLRQKCLRVCRQNIGLINNPTAQRGITAAFLNVLKSSVSKGKCFTAVPKSNCVICIGC